MIQLMGLERVYFEGLAGFDFLLSLAVVFLVVCVSVG